MNRIRVKFCGITRAQDALDAVALGVDAIGLVFVPGSRREVNLEQARAIVREIPAFVATVGLFMDANAADVAAIRSELALDLLQFHGSESPEYCAGFGHPYIKALPMGDGLHLQSTLERYASARSVLLDAHRSGELGGRGEVFDWARIPRQLAGRIVLAGGLNPENVASAITAVRPYAVDVSSGIESAPGVKCPQRMQAFMNEVERAGREPQQG